MLGILLVAEKRAYSFLSLYTVGWKQWKPTFVAKSSFFKFNILEKNFLRSVNPSKPFLYYSLNYYFCASFLI